MAENLRPAVPPPASDLAGTEGCGSAVTRGSSDLSASTVDGSKACLRSNGDARSVIFSVLSCTGLVFSVWGLFGV